jgi:chaperonin GroES
MGALGNRVFVIEDDPTAVTPGGILLPDQSQQGTQTGTVAHVGPGKVYDSGERHQMTVKPGDRVLFSNPRDSEATVDGQKYTILDEEWIHAVLDADGRVA